MLVKDTGPQDTGPQAPLWEPRRQPAEAFAAKGPRPVRSEVFRRGTQGNCFSPTGVCGRLAVVARRRGCRRRGGQDVGAARPVRSTGDVGSEVGPGEAVASERPMRAPHPAVFSVATEPFLAGRVSRVRGLRAPAVSPSRRATATTPRRSGRREEHRCPSRGRGRLRRVPPTRSWRGVASVSSWVAQLGFGPAVRRAPRAAGLLGRRCRRRPSERCPAAGRNRRRDAGIRWPGRTSRSSGRSDTRDVVP